MFCWSDLLKVCARNKVAVLKLRNHAVVPGGSGAVAVQVSLLLTREASVLVQALDPVIPESVVDTSTALSKALRRKSGLRHTLFWKLLFGAPRLACFHNRLREGVGVSVSPRRTMPVSHSGLSETSRGPDDFLYDEDWLSSGKCLSSGHDCHKSGIVARGG